MKHFLSGLTALLLIPLWTAHGEVEGGNFTVLYERTFRGCAAVLAATDRFLFVSDSGHAPDDTRPDGVAMQAEDGAIKGYSPLFRQPVIRLLLCDRSTGEVVHKFSGPVSRRPRVSGFELSLTWPPVMLEDGFVSLTADWHLQRIELSAGDGGPVRLWDLDIPVATGLTPRLSDDMGYLMPVVSRCGGTLLFTFNSAPSGSGNRCISRWRR
ncbi:MAG: hypothetical protein JWM59_3631 [Verrucomicrobiales bacterium]|nr:hypothetical protein [Verrucomicrobiales bacterium]